MENTIQKAYDTWCNYEFLQPDIHAQLMDMDAHQVEDAFFKNLSFGTGGLRGKIGAGTNRMNVYTVLRATNGLKNALLLEHQGAGKPSCVISYDSRNMSKEFAHLSAACLAQGGIKVHVFDTLMPTPVLSYAVRYLKASAGIMVTASHNAKEYNGYKVYGDDGCQITLDMADKILSFIEKEDMLVKDIPNFETVYKEGNIAFVQQDLLDSYYDIILNCTEKSADTPLKIVYSPLNGTGNVPVQHVLKNMQNVTFSVVKEQEMPDKNFTTCPYPNPETKEAMALAMRDTVEKKADFCLATDPDCDRVGVGVYKEGEVVLLSGNETGVILLDYLLKHTTKKDPVVVKTIVTTDMADAICAHYHATLKNVLTGFKFIGEQIALLQEKQEENRYLFGFEESYGYLSTTKVRDKDGVNAVVLIVRAAQYYKEKGWTLLDALEHLKAQYGHFGQRLMSFSYEGKEGQDKMQRIMHSLRHAYKESAFECIKNAEVTDYLLQDTGLPKSDVLTFNMKEMGKLIIRPSGTEPKLKAYLFQKAENEQALQTKLDKLSDIANSLLG